MKKNRMFNKCTIYFSHPIRGSNNDFKRNCKKTIAAANKLRKVFPEVDFYVPAEHDLPLQWLYDNARITIGDILDADLAILENCSGWFFYNFDSSKGSTIEQDRAIELGFCNECNCVFSSNVEKASYGYIRKMFNPVVESAKKRFRKIK